MLMGLCRYAVVLACLLLGSHAHAQAPASERVFNAWVAGRPLSTAPLGATDAMPIIQGGQTRRIFPNSAFMRPDGSNITTIWPGALGGTGVVNTGKTITLGDNLVTGGALTTAGAFTTGGDFATGGAFSTAGTFSTAGAFATGGAFTTGGAFSTAGPVATTGTGTITFAFPNTTATFTTPTTSKTLLATDGSNVSLPAAPNALLGNSVAHTYFARAYGSCPWTQDGLGDNSPCILSAIAAALLDQVSTGGFTYGGAQVVLPSGGPYGITNNILQNGATGVRLVGAGGVGSYGYCKTALQWNGANTGTMVQFGDDSATGINGGGIGGICLHGNSTTVGTGAANGIVARSQIGALYEDFFIYNVNSIGIDLAPSALDTRGLSRNTFRRGQVSLASAGAINAHGIVWSGTANQDVFMNVFDDINVQHQNGDGWRCGNSDTNYVRSSSGQPIGGAVTGRSLRLMGSATGPYNLSECRENDFHGWFGTSAATGAIAEAGPVLAVVTASQSATTVTVTGVTSGALVVGHMLYGASMETPARITAFGTGAGGTGTYTVSVSQTAISGTVSASFPSIHNYVRQMATGSGIYLPTLETGASLCYDSDRGEHYCNATGASTFIHGGLAYKATGTNGAVFDIDTANTSNFATVAKFGPTNPIYLHYGSTPTVGFNAFWNSASWRYGKGSAASYAGSYGFNIASGLHSWTATAATGNADAAATLATIATLDRAGTFAPAGHILLNNALQLQSKDSGGTTRGLLQLFSNNVAYLDGGAGGLTLRSNYGAATIGASDITGNFSFSQQLKADNIRAVNSSSASHTLHNDGTNTDINAPTGGNLDLRVGNVTTMRATAAGASMQVGTLSGIPTPSAASDAVPKSYADSIAAGVVTHASVVAKSTANLTATYANGASGVGATLTNSGALAALVLDGVTINNGDRILIANQSTTFENGIYTQTTAGTGAIAWILTRATDFDAAAANEVAAGAAVITVGGTQAATQWVETGQGAFTIGTTPIVFSQVLGGSSGGTVSGGTTSQLAYYAANGTTVSGLTTGNNGVLVTSAGGVPSIGGALPNAIQDAITRLGTVTLGTWNGTIVGQAYGGSGANMTATGGTSHVVRQASAGAVFTTGQLNFTELAGNVSNAMLTNSSVTFAGKTAALGAAATIACADLSNDAPSCSTDTTNAGNISTGTLAINRLPTFAHTQSTVASPTGVAVGLTRMQGLAGTITPTATGTVRFSVCGDATNSAAIGITTVQLRTGTGAAPANGAAVTGTTRGLVKNMQGVAPTTNRIKSAFCVGWTVTGLVLSTAVWIDVSVGSTVGTATIANVDIVADELL